MSAVIDEVVLSKEDEINAKDSNRTINGEEKNMAGARHSGVGMRLGAEIWFHVRANNLGGVYGPDATFVIGNRDRLPDISFVSAARIPVDGEPESKWHFAPDLAVEIISPNDIYSEVEEKIHEYFLAGVKQVWVISSEYRTLTVYISPTQVTILTENDELTCEELLPGFRLKLKDIFKMPQQTKSE